MRSGKLRSETRVASDVSLSTREQMWRLFERYYVDVDRETFDRDLANKTHVILLFDSGDQSLQGFSNVEIYRRVIEGRRVQVVYSGDTVIEREYWGQGVVQRAYAALYVKQKLAHPFEPLFYFLLSKGYKTYLLLTRSYPQHWPRHDAETPPDKKAILDALAREKYGALYDAERGIIHMGVADGRLREDVAPIVPSMLADPDIRFFAEQNPGHTQADELCCLAEVSFTTPLRYVASRALRKLRGRAPSHAVTASAR